MRTRARETPPAADLQGDWWHFSFKGCSMRKQGKSRQRIYYAHALCMYGWPAERAELRHIKREFRGWVIVNPGTYQDHPEKRLDTMGFCLRLVDAVDAVVFSRIEGKISCGVGKEVNHALKRRKPVYELRDGKLIRCRRRVRYVPRQRVVSLYERWRLTQYRNSRLRPR